MFYAWSSSIICYEEADVAVIVLNSKDTIFYRLSERVLSEILSVIPKHVSGITPSTVWLRPFLNPNPVTWQHNVFTCPNVCFVYVLNKALFFVDTYHQSVTHLYQTSR